MNQSPLIGRAEKIIGYLESRTLDSPSLVIAPYRHPDLDGIACALALEHLLHSLGQRNVRSFFGGLPHREAQFVIDTLGVNEPLDEKLLTTPPSLSDEVLLVDFSDPLEMPAPLRTSQVRAIIDHRVFSHVEKYNEVTVWIDPVGAAATLICELYSLYQQKIPKKIALYLYGAIISNTADLGSSGTTERDRKSAETLLFLCGEQEARALVTGMFEAKSDLSTCSLYDVLERDTPESAYLFEDQQVTGAQLEIIKFQDLWSNRRHELVHALEEIRNSRKADWGWLSIISLEEKKTYFLFTSEKAYERIHQALPLTLLESPLYMKNEIVFRKDIWAALYKKER